MGMLRRTKPTSAANAPEARPGATRRARLSFSGCLCVNHGAGQYVDKDAHVNSIEGFWARLKLSIRGTHAHMSGKHLWKYVKEFEYRYNRRSQPETIFRDLFAHL